jgi:hypothetical protein
MIKQLQLERRIVCDCYLGSSEKVVLFSELVALDLKALVLLLELVLGLAQRVNVRRHVIDVLLLLALELNQRLFVVVALVVDLLLQVGYLLSKSLASFDLIFSERIFMRKIN